MATKHPAGRHVAAPQATAANGGGQRHLGLALIVIATAPTGLIGLVLERVRSSTRLTMTAQ